MKQTLPCPNCTTSVGGPFEWRVHASPTCGYCGTLLTLVSEWRPAGDGDRRTIRLAVDVHRYRDIVAERDRLRARVKELEVTRSTP